MNRLSKGIVILSTVVLLSFALLFFTSNSSSVLTTSISKANDVMSTIHSIFSGPTTFLSKQKDFLIDLLSTYDENQELKATISQLENLEEQVATLTKENKSLKENLAAKSSATEVELTAAMVIARSPIAWNKTVTIDVGKQEGITNDMLVTADGGLIGLVSTVYSDSSEVSLLIDDHSAIKLPVKIRTGEQAVYGILSGYDVDTNSFIVSQLNSSAEIVEGSSVVTSDFGGKTPANVQIGAVKMIQSETNSLNRTVYVSPKADFSNLYSVLVVRK